MKADGQAYNRKDLRKVAEDADPKSEREEQPLSLANTDLPGTESAAPTKRPLPLRVRAPKMLQKALQLLSRSPRLTTKLPNQ